jgi:hypothetical protein
MKLIFEYEEGDGFTYAHTLTVPFEYETKEKAEEYFIKLIVEGDSFSFLNFQFHPQFEEDLTDKVTFYTLEEWLTKEMRTV